MKQNRLLVYIFVGIFLFTVIFFVNDLSAYNQIKINDTISIVNSNYLCGNGTCDYDLGENPLNCPIDCIVKRSFII
ncbi:MAG: hypothetical protein PHR26_00110 [Candidatus ainarchaeum sp.]|nr:hypothetical protein [Candidatus ainarchaeum sp.]MDD3976076.1 hypothetical protein [Candidatus ainarchaeum sp.]